MKIGLSDAKPFGIVNEREQNT